MTVHLKLMQARVKLTETALTKSGHNKFAGYRYFELGDFLPTVQKIFLDLKLCGVVTFGTDTATLTVHDADKPLESIVFSTPMSTAELKGCHPVQNLGAVQTYIRRYLWTAAMEIVEGDALDATTGAEPVKLAPVKSLKEETKAPAKAVDMAGKDGPWQLKIVADEGAPWPDVVKETVDQILQITGSVDDVQSIYRSNKGIFDRLKTEDAKVYEQVMHLFKLRKETITKEAA